MLLVKFVVADALAEYHRHVKIRRQVLGSVLMMPRSGCEHE